MPVLATFGGISSIGFGSLPDGAFELIQSITVGSGGASSVTFDNIPQTYTHLQLRYLCNSSAAAVEGAIYTVFNNDNSSSYRCHRLNGDGSSAGAFAPSAGPTAGFIGTWTNTSTGMAANVTDILDYTSTSKNKVWRTLSGTDKNGSGFIALWSGFWPSTSAVSSIQLIPNSGTFQQHSTFSLYGVR